jgi:DNA primase
MSDDLIRRVKGENDIVDVIGRHVELRPAGERLKGVCPFCQREKFYVDPKWQNYRCWSCGKYGDVLAFVQEHDHCTFAEALDRLAACKVDLTVANVSKNPDDMSEHAYRRGWHHAAT